MQFIWGPRRQACFEQVKQLLASKCLRLFDPSLDIFVTTDASTIGLGAVPQQRKDRELVTVASASSKLTPQELQYSASEQEALACLLASEHWGVYYWGRQFTLRADHQALLTLLSAEGADRRPFHIARWYARFLAFKYKIEFKKGDKDVVADALSKLPEQKNVDNTEPRGAFYVVSYCATHQELVAKTLREPLLQQVRKWLMSSWPTAKILPAEATLFYACGISCPSRGTC